MCKNLTPASYIKTQNSHKSRQKPPSSMSVNGHMTVNAVCVGT